MTMAQIKEKFHQADLNGNGRLSPKEFKLVLKAFGIEIPERDMNILIERFDMDNDGEIDMHEFLAFIESEQKSFGGGDSSTVKPPAAVNTGKTSSTAFPSPTAAARRPASAGKPSHKNNTTPARVMRPSTAEPSHNVTAPGMLQNKPASRSSTSAGITKVVPDAGLVKTAPVATRSENDSYEPLLSGSLTKTVGSGKGTKVPVGELGEQVDVLWMSRMLQAQAEIEARLGRRYYKNN